MKIFKTKTIRAGKHKTQYQNEQTTVMFYVGEYLTYSFD